MRFLCVVHAFSVLKKTHEFWVVSIVILGRVGVIGIKFWVVFRPDLQSQANQNHFLLDFMSDNKYAFYQGE